jgi:hypothetical protein
MKKKGVEQKAKAKANKKAIRTSFFWFRCVSFWCGCLSLSQYGHFSFPTSGQAAD